MKRAVAAVLMGCFCASVGCAQAPAFEVASVRVNENPGRGLGSIQYSADTLTFRGTSMWMILRWAYGMESYQISGTDSLQMPPYYDIVAKAAGAVPKDALRLMLRALLAERFHLVVSHEKKEMRVTALVVARGGVKFQASDGKYDAGRGPEAQLQFLGFDNDIHVQRRHDADGSFRDSVTNAPLAVLAGVVAGMASMTPYDKVAVVDGTGMPGRFDFVYHHLPMRSPGGKEGGEGNGADDVLSNFKSILEKEPGLTLEGRREMVEVLVVDHVDRTPTEN